MLFRSVAQLAAGKSHVEGVELSGIGNYRATSVGADIDGSNVVIIAVPTPLNSGRKPDLSYLESACETVAKYLKNNALIINESTSFPGTLRELIAESIEKGSGLGHLYAASPERVDPGNPVWNQANTPR